VLQTYALAHGAAVPINLRAEMLYNPGLVSSFFLCRGGVAYSGDDLRVAHQHYRGPRAETGTLEQLLVSPMRPLEFIIGKLQPYVALALAIGCVILLLGHVMFHVALWAAVAAAGALAAVHSGGVSLGLMISTIVTTS
jgi:ABC-2 type transport system permease protein